MVRTDKDLYTVSRPVYGEKLFRLAEQEAGAFASNFERGDSPLPSEDAAIHRGFSALASEALARRYVDLFDAPRKRGEPPRWNLIIEFALNPGLGHVIADTGRPGHYTAWGRKFRILRDIPI